MSQPADPADSPPRTQEPAATHDVPGAAQWLNFLGVDYLHLKTADGGDLYLTKFALPFWRNLLPEHWYVPEWFKSKRVRLDGTSTVYRVPTMSVGGRVVELVVKFSRVGEDIPMDTFTINKFVNAEFNSPFEEFSLLMELRRGAHGPKSIRIRTQKPLAIYVPPERLRLWQTGRSERRIRAKIARHPGVEIDILRQYVVLFGWIKGLDAVETAELFKLPARSRKRFISHVNSLVIHELAQKGYRVIDMKPQHVILRPRSGRKLLREHDHQFAYALIDYELLERTPEHEAVVRSETRRFYLSHMAHRFDPPASGPLPDHLHHVELLGVDYVFGHADSTGGLLWVVGTDPELFPYFLPERWRRTPGRQLGAGGQAHYTCTKDNVHLVWRISRLGDSAQPGDPPARQRAIEAAGYNSPFEEIAIAMACERAGVKTVYPRAIYMTGSPGCTIPAGFDDRHHRCFSAQLTPDGDPVIRPDRDYIALFGFWDGTDAMLDANAEHRNRAVSGEQACATGLIAKTTVAELLRQTRDRLLAHRLEPLDLRPDHLLLSYAAAGNLIVGTDGIPEVRLCNFELIRRL
jgi:hypothetical protein